MNVVDNEIKKSYEIENNLKEKLDNDIKTEEEILSSSINLANDLLSSGKASITINNKLYSVVMKISTKEKKMQHRVTKKVKSFPVRYISIIAADVNKYKLSNGKYIPFTISAEVDERYNLKDNLKTVTEAFLRHVTGTVKASYMEDK